MQFESLGKNEQGYFEYEHRESGVIMVLVPAGEFTMGSPTWEFGHEIGEAPIRRVQVSRFLISKYEISREVWKRVMNEQPDSNQPYTSLEPPNGSFPVNFVSWNDCYGSADSFCKSLGFKLPTEAQWEYACRAKTKTPFAFGPRLNKNQASFGGHRGGKMVSVDSFQPNAFGLYNMHGNVLEWCEDNFELNAYSKEGREDGDVPYLSDSKYRVLRGGSWNYMEGDCRSAARYKGLPDKKLMVYGLRPVRSYP